jgi:lipopolysaccharide/colanic/teichoic acid biosynthesis glycosyltransferase
MKAKRDSNIYLFLKRIFDLFISITGILILLPLYLFIGIIIKFHDRGPVFYHAKRVGLGGNEFHMFKFRTMIQDADKIGPSSASISDNRITGIGNYLRKYKLDELPQLFNVLKGDMSIVRPRPEVKKFTDLFSETEKIILSVKPGITDWASLWNSNEAELLEGAEDPDQLYMMLIRPGKIDRQIEYVNNHNFFIDLEIFFFTLLKIILGNKIRDKE